MLMGRKWMGINTFFVAIVFVAGLCGCSDSEGSVGKLELTLTHTTVSATDNAQFVLVNCDGDWTISIGYPEGTDAWCESKPAMGQRSQQIVLEYARNTEEKARTAVISLNAGNRSATVELTQKGTGGDSGDSGGGDGDGGGDSGDVENHGWLELPKLETAADCRFITHYVKVGSKNVRNFSMYFDTDERIAYWVAYPHCKMYLGSVGRSNDFRPDPNFSDSEQMTGTVPGYDRGHQIPSGDRTANKEMNSQTFYYSNMTPQLGSFNQKIWVDMETKVRNWLNGCDTMYVVTGAVLKTVGGNENVEYAADKNGQKIAVPNYYFKVLLQLRLNNGTPSYQAIGFWFDHKANSGSVTSTYARTVDYIEEKTGFDFFSNLPQSVQEQVESRFEPAKWGIN